jgi:hypothetical protein
MRIDARDARPWTNKVLEAMNEGVLHPEWVATICLGWLSEADVKEMCQANDIADFLGDESRLDEDEEELA